MRLYIRVGSGLTLVLHGQLVCSDSELLGAVHHVGGFVLGPSEPLPTLVQSLAGLLHCTGHAVGCRVEDTVASQQLGLAVEEVRFAAGAVALAGVMQDLDKCAFLSRGTGHPLVQGVVEHQVKLWTVFIGVYGVDLSELVNSPL